MNMVKLSLEVEHIVDLLFPGLICNVADAPGPPFIFHQCVRFPMGSSKEEH